MSKRVPEGKFAGTVKVGEKGQIVIPKGAREIFDIQPGDTLVLLADKKRGIAIGKFGLFRGAFEAILGPEEENEENESD